MRVKTGQRVMIVEHPGHILPEVVKNLVPIEAFVHGPAPSTPGHPGLWRVGVKDVAQVVVHEDQLAEPDLAGFFVSYVQEDATAGTMKIITKTPGQAVLEAMHKISDMIEDGEPLVIVASRCKLGQHVTEVVMPARPRMKVEGS